MAVPLVCVWCGGNRPQHNDGCPDSGRLRKETHSAPIPYVQPPKKKEEDADEAAGSESNPGSWVHGAE